MTKKIAILLCWLLAACTAETLTVLVLCDTPSNTLTVINRNMGKTYKVEPNEPGGFITLRYLDYVYLTGDVNGDGKVSIEDKEAVQAMIPDAVTTVYRAPTGTTYHKAGCRYLKTNSLAIELTAATMLGLKPCSVCQKPQF